ncbi:hypothetical protein FJZ20_02785 [Candidatus Pacearchaeota archaeon]|nr:hypothetical protein [Candidatus Pacearchaeota archaeon]
MNIWIFALLLGLLVVGAIFVTGVSDVKAETDNSEIIPCSTCGQGCTLDRNCGSSTCGALTGTSDCGCGR